MHPAKFSIIRCSSAATSSATTLRSIVLARPQTLSQLKTISGLANEKIEKFGAGILEICST